MMCANCYKNDGLCYTSFPPKYRCTIDGEFRSGVEGCDLYDKGYNKGKTDVVKHIEKFINDYDGAIIISDNMGVVSGQQVINELKQVVEQLKE